jgi:arsenate reductase
MHLLFVCVGNTCRSQLAEAIARHLGFEASSAGTHPGMEIAGHTLAVLKDRGIDTSGLRPKSIDEVNVDAADMIFSMGCGVQCPNLPLDDDWGLDDPVHKERAVYEATADEITRRLQRLIEAQS